MGRKPPDRPYHALQSKVSDEPEEEEDSVSKRSKAELYESASDQVRDTTSKQLDAHHQVTQRAIDLVKINLLMLSAVFAGVSLGETSIPLTLVAGIIALLYSIWCCVIVFSPTLFERGIGREGAIQIDKEIQKGKSKHEVYREQLYTYAKITRNFTEKFSDEKGRFSNALWATLTAMFFLAAGSVLINLGLIYFPLELFLLVILPVLALWGKDKQSE